MRVSGVWLVCVGWLPACAANCSNPPPFSTAASMQLLGHCFGFLCWLPNVMALFGLSFYYFAERPSGREANHKGLLASHLESLCRFR